MSKEMTINALGEHVKITLPDVSSVDRKKCFELPYGLLLHYETNDNDEGGVKYIRVVISDGCGDLLSEYSDSCIGIDDIEKLTKEAIYNIEDDVNIKLEEANMVIYRYSKISEELKNKVF